MLIFSSPYTSTWVSTTRWRSILKSREKLILKARDHYKTFCGSVNGVLRLLNSLSQNRNASPEGSVVWTRTSILWIKSWVLFLALKPLRCGNSTGFTEGGAWAATERLRVWIGNTDVVMQGDKVRFGKNKRKTEVAVRTSLGGGEPRCAWRGLLCTVSCCCCSPWHSLVL